MGPLGVAGMGLCLGLLGHQGNQGPTLGATSPLGGWPPKGPWPPAWGGEMHSREGYAGSDRPPTIP